MSTPLSASPHKYQAFAHPQIGVKQPLAEMLFPAANPVIQLGGKKLIRQQVGDGIISFKVNGDPVGQPRARGRAFTPRGGGKPRAMMYNPETAKGWKTLITCVAKAHRPDAPFTSPVSVNATFYFSRPKSHYRTGRYAHELRSDAPMWHFVKPDRDNLDKALLDALTQVGGFWEDDCQVCDGTVRKMYGMSPGVHVQIKALNSLQEVEG